MRSALFTVSVLALIAVAATFLFVPYFPQNPAYHAFADQRPLFGIANGWNVLSNLPFALVGIAALMTIRGAAATTFGIGLVLTGLGSSLYHLDPNNRTLLYDRGGMVVVLMALVALLVDAYDGRREIVTLVIAEMIGITSLVVWVMTGDLRLYGVVQFFPGLLILLLPLRERRLWTRLHWVVVFYAVAKLCETFDAQIYDASRVVSGHTLKHLAAAASTVVIWRWIVSRQPRAVESSPPGEALTSSPARDTTI